MQNRLNPRVQTAFFAAISKNNFCSPADKSDKVVWLRALAII
ncbi:TPA: hypothetical protein ACX48P_000059 [Neisseria meningitidis]|nr:hypothetical protein [Neisseria meningitidis]MDA3728030.1 hypothetical protein [Neisseria meningitidis]